MLKSVAGQWPDDPKKKNESLMSADLLKVVIFTSVPPRRVEKIIARIRRDAPKAKVVGVLYERRPPKNLKQRVATWRKKMPRPVYWRYVAHRMVANINRKVSGLLDGIIRFIHAGPKNPNGDKGYGLDDLAATCKADGIELLITRDCHAEESLNFVRSLDADLGLVFGTRILKPVLFEIPKQGSINIHKRKVPDYRGGGAVGLWEMLDDQKEIGVTVHRVEAKVDVGGVIRSAVIPIDPFDDLESLALKADVVGNDLIVAAIRDFANGTVQRDSAEWTEQTVSQSNGGRLVAVEKEVGSAASQGSQPVSSACLETAAQVVDLRSASCFAQSAAAARGNFSGDDSLPSSCLRSSTSLWSFDALFPEAGELSAAALSGGEFERGGRTDPKGWQHRADSSHHVRRWVRRQFCEPARDHRRNRSADWIFHFHRAHFERSRICARSGDWRTRIFPQYMGAD